MPLVHHKMNVWQYSLTSELPVKTVQMSEAVRTQP
jgi:hypothetical protein